MNKLLGIFVPIIGLLFWLNVIDTLASRKAKDLLSLNQCYEISGNPYQVVSKERDFYVVQNYRNKNIKKLYYDDNYWYYKTYKKTSCQNGRSVASNINKKSNSVIESWFKGLKDSTEKLWK